MAEQESKDPLHGKTLEVVLAELVEKVGWEKMGQRIKIRCFIDEPSIKSSLVFLPRWRRVFLKSRHKPTTTNGGINAGKQ